MKTKKIMPTLIMVILFSFAAALITLGAGNQRSIEKAVQAGNNLDIYLGQCGMFLLDAPVDGTITLERDAKGKYPYRFVKDICTVDYESRGGQSITSFGGYLIYYIVLDKGQHDMWMDGDLAFATHGSGGWTKCNATLVADGNFGRLACWSNTFGSYGLVDIHEKAADEDEDAKASKPPAGVFVTSGSTVDVSQGTCGVYMSNTPADGYFDLDKEAKGKFPPRFIKDVCDFTYVDADEKPLNTGGALTIGYVNLNQAQETAYLAGDLAFFTNNGSGWNQCTNPMLLSENGSPRLCCTMSGQGMFGIADVSVKDTDNGD